MEDYFALSWPIYKGEPVYYDSKMVQNSNNHKTSILGYSWRLNIT